MRYFGHTIRHNSLRKTIIQGITAGEREREREEEAEQQNPGKRHGRMN